MELLFIAYGVFIGGAFMFIFQTHRKINAYDRHREWCDREWEKHWTNEPNTANRHEWAERNLIYREGWRNGINMDTDGPSGWRF